MKNSFASTLANRGWRLAVGTSSPLTRLGIPTGHLCIRQYLSEGRLEILKCLPVQSAQGPQETVTLQGALEIQHDSPSFTRHATA